MRLQTDTRPRRDGTVITRARDGREYRFTADADGLLSCDVDDQVLAAALLAGGRFWPADDADAEKALALVNSDDDADDDDEEQDDGGDVSEAAGPVEANTPPAPARRGRPRKNPE